MRISAQQHYDGTREACDWGLLLICVAVLGLGMYWNWTWLLAMPKGTKVVLALIALFALGWPRMAMGRLLCEIVRECTSAQCAKCGGPAWFEASDEGSYSTAPVAYRCARCGCQELLKSAYCDEAPKSGNDTNFDGGGGGGG